ncbi:MAG: A-factor type gamma-butyrolactone 1'-reductase (1S-forming) [Chroococcidiopsis sp. SAG 2025]|uniref:SDR family oxidoreductase n=1 Tax=Chroococcidiopsis sp. SAG 2025 TaxID=171389 RepID=UPI002937123C|nr:SDR family oxidoreductase [Chroococcidiopsis sp. SAG 2025]MDV2996930.1 A-factor type gamma-butyrolactone 1'-reductase (1S-forming) [Chroococcidiopsis sp. SAG 2025]
MRLIQEAEAKGLFLKANITQASDVKQLMNTVVEKYGRLDCTFNNAAIEGTLEPFIELPEAESDKVIATNLKSVWLCMKYEIQQMLEQGGGAIVNTSSMAGLVGFPNMAPYVAAKHGVLGLTRSVALEYASSGIRINAVYPGVIDNAGQSARMLDKYGQDKDDVAKQNPSGRLGTPEEIANAVLFLCSDQSLFITGHPLSVDGGYVAR